MPTLVWCGSGTQQTHAGLFTGGTQTKYWDAGNGTPGTQVSVVQDSDFASGWCFEINGSAAAAFMGLNNAANNGVLGSSGTLVGGFKFKFPSLPTADWDILRVIGTAGGNDGFLRFINSSDTLSAILGASSQGGPGVTASTINRVDYKVVLNSGTQTFDWQVNGTAQTQVVLSATTQNLFKAGFGNDQTTQAGTVRIGDIVFSLTAADYPLGPHKIILLTVDPAGTFTIGGGGAATNFNTFAGATPTLTAWNASTARDAVDEVPPNLQSAQDGFCVVTDIPTNTWYVEMPMTTYTLSGSETISGARAVVCGWQQIASGANCGLRFWDGTTETTILNNSTSFTTLGNNSTSPGWICRNIVGTAFNTQGKMDGAALRFGFSTDANPDIGVQAAYIEVAIAGTAASPAGKTPQLTSQYAGFY